MTETPLDYDRIIWEVFSVGIVSSVIILYYVILGNIKGYEILALFLGFSILTYSFMLVRGYGKKKNILSNMIKNHLPFQDESHELNRRHIIRLDRESYFRVRWIGEIILFIIAFYYVYVFYSIEKGFILIPLIIVSLFVFLSSIANQERN